MKSKSPFSKKSPLKLQVYRGDTYESPDTVITRTVGEQVGTAITGLADNAVDYMNTKSERDRKKRDSSGTIATHGLGGGEYKGFGGGMKEINLPETPDVNTNITNPNDFSRFTGSTDLVSKSKTSSNTKGETFKDQNAWDNNRNDVQSDPRFQGEGGKEKFFTAAQDYRDKNGAGINTTFDKGKTRFEDGKRTLAINMKGSPVKHNAGAVGSIGNPRVLAGGMAGVAQAASQGGSVVGSIGNANPLAGGIAGIGQQISNQAQQRAADAGGSTGVDPFLPPPNQVAETGSYGGSGDRILEMDSNPVGNQSIGRNTDITSQLFGSGQRASMLAMKGTPLHTKGHADDYEGHTHRKKGKSYEVGEYIDETDFESLNTSLNAYDRGEIQKDKKSQFIVTKNEDYNPTQIDTIRPSKGKQFKMGWGDAERNISTNPKYKKSK